jgi:hypothetical protein
VQRYPNHNEVRQLAHEVHLLRQPA